MVAALLEALAAEPGLRLAEPGEFTRRAVENGRLDLTQAEAIADLVAAETQAQRRQAYGQFEGKLAELYEGWRSNLIRAAAWVEASIDFPDEEIPLDAIERSRGAIASIAGEIRVHLDDGRRGEILPEIPGTTRDVIEVRLDLKGYPVILADTAGLREARGPIEEEGIRRAQARALSADLRLLLLDGSLSPPKSLPSAELKVWSKADLVSVKDQPGIWISSKTGEGLPELIDVLASYAEGGLGHGEAPVITRARHRQALEEAAGSLEQAVAEEAPELAAEQIRRALQAIGRITGRVDLDELLDVVFRDFCLGK